MQRKGTKQIGLAINTLEQSTVLVNKYMFQDSGLLES